MDFLFEPREGDLTSSLPHGFKTAHRFDESCIRVMRIFVSTECALNIPDGSSFSERVALDSSSVPSSDDPWVSIVVHNTSVFDKTSTEKAKALSSVLVNRGLRGDAESGDNSTSLMLPISIIEAVTPIDRDRIFVAERSGVKGNDPSMDPIMRCVRLIRDLSRALVAGFQRNVHPVSYENLDPWALIFYGNAVVDNWTGRVRLIHNWDSEQLMMLDHTNFPGFHTLDEVVGIDDPRLIGWMEELRLGSPFFRWRELVVSAHRSIEVDGDYATGLIQCQTAGEVLIDGLLCLLAWEEGLSPVQVRSLFDSRQFGSRVSLDLASRLGGNWSTGGDGAYAIWDEKVRLVRNKVVHAGYDPSWLECQASFDATFNLMKYCFDRLAEKRNKYPKAVLITLGESGLCQRGLWSGKILRFANEVATVQPSWRAEFADWRLEFASN